MGAYLILQVSSTHGSSSGWTRERNGGYERNIVTYYATASQYPTANTTANLRVLFPSRLGANSILQPVCEF